MKAQHQYSSLSLLSTLLLPISTFAAFTGQAEVDGVKWDLTPLAVHSVVSAGSDHPPSWTNWTWTINPNGVIPTDGETGGSDHCPSGTQICGVEWLHKPDDPQDSKGDAISYNVIASDANGESVAATFQRLKTVEGSEDEGVRVELHGGNYNNEKQSAIVDFICDPAKTGNEDGSVPDQLNSLQFVGYAENVLKLQWRTEYACEDSILKRPAEKNSGSWGFFTWFIVIIFLVVAAYLIFGSWLNYNKYGARGYSSLSFLSSSSSSNVHHHHCLSDIFEEEENENEQADIKAILRKGDEEQAIADKMGLIAQMGPLTAQRHAEGYAVPHQRLLPGDDQYVSRWW